MSGPALGTRDAFFKLRWHTSCWFSRPFPRKDRLNDERCVTHLPRSLRPALSARLTGPGRLSEGAREATYPHGYPNGWDVLAESDDVRRGQVIETNALGQRLAVYRSDVDGTVGVLEAHCPHLGANLARRTVQGAAEVPVS